MSSKALVALRVALALAGFFPAVVLGQRSSNLGLAAVGAIGVQGSIAWLEREDRGYELGVLADIGWTGAPSLRLQAELDFMAAHLVETVEIEDRTFRGPFFDLAGSVSAVFLASGRTAPYLLGGVSVHALSSDFGTLSLDRRYNTNQFGVVAGAGLRIWTGDAGRQIIAIEARRVISENVDRTLLRIGFLHAFNDLIRPR